ncbi:MAG: hypothetical protein V1774_01665 [Candidatus Eisenbacteria bacterium]
MAHILPSKPKGHLAVAALRVLQHGQGRPARSDEIASLLGWGHEETLVILRGLVEIGILKMHETPFEARFELRDHAKLEELPEEGEEAELEEEVADFQRRNRSRREEIERMLREGELEQRKKKKAADLEKQFDEFRKKKRPAEED